MLKCYFIEKTTGSKTEVWQKRLRVKTLRGTGRFQTASAGVVVVVESVQHLETKEYCHQQSNGTPNIVLSSRLTG